jgi:hypothetical protein
MPNSSRQAHPKPKRPLPVTLILWILALWSLLGWLRFAQTVAERELIIRLVGPGLHAYLLLAGLAWGMLALPVLWGVLRRASWAPVLLAAAGVLYPAFYWIERLLLWQDPAARRNWPFMLLLTALWFGLVAWGLRAASIKEYFTDSD